MRKRQIVVPNVQYYAHCYNPDDHSIVTHPVIAIDFEWISNPDENETTMVGSPLVMIADGEVMNIKDDESFVSLNLCVQPEPADIEWMLEIGKRHYDNRRAIDTEMK